MGVRYRKTDAGREEIRSRGLKLPRPARNLLLIIDPSRDADAWLGLVQGAGPADLDGLLAEGLIAAASPTASCAVPAPPVGVRGAAPVTPSAGPPATSPAGSGGPAASAPPAPSLPHVPPPPPARPPWPAVPTPASDDAADGDLVAALHRLPYSALYDVLTAQARARLGLIKGYRLVLEIERCSDVAALQVLATRFVAQLRAAQGDAGVEPLRRALAAPG